MKKTITFQAQHLHLDSGEIVPAWIRCSPGEPLDIKLGQRHSVDIELTDELHVALARVDPHVHFRESVIPSPEEFAKDPYHPADQTYESLLERIQNEKQNYDVQRGSLAALKGGVWLVGAMGNVAWPPLGRERWEKMDRYYREQAQVFTHVWPRIELGIPPIVGQEEKDFGSTFGGSGIATEQRREMYFQRQGGMISYHNDKPRDDISMAEFREQVQPPGYLLHHLYYDGERVLAAQREIFDIAREAQLKRLLTRHIPTGPALEMILTSRVESEVELPAEVGLDYLYFNRDMLHSRATRWINYRRPALPSCEDQASLIELTREAAQRHDPLTFIGSDHAPHTFQAKQMKEDGLPGSPGTRVLEHTQQVLMNLIHTHNFSHADVDWLTSIVPARYIAQYRDFPYPVGKMEAGAMANLVIFNSHETYQVDEAQLRKQLYDPEYHTAYRDESLRGKVYFTVVNGQVYDVQHEVKAL